MPYRTTFNHQFWLYTLVASLVFVLVMGTILVSVVLWRRGAARTLSRTHKNTPLEVGFALSVLAVAAFLITMSFTWWGDEQAFSSSRSALTVDVTALQWCWRFSYQGTPVTVEGDCEAGQYPTLTVPEGTTVRINLESNDVVHELWVPYLRYKKEAFPNHVNSFDIKVDRTGSWRGLCDEFCGLYHESMDFTLRSVSPAAFQAWIQRQSTTTTTLGAGPVPTHLPGKP